MWGSDRAVSSGACRVPGAGLLLTQSKSPTWVCMHHDMLRRRPNMTMHCKQSEVPQLAASWSKRVHCTASQADATEQRQQLAATRSVKVRCKQSTCCSLQHCAWSKVCVKSALTVPSGRLLTQGSPASPGKTSRVVVPTVVAGEASHRCSCPKATASPADPVDGSLLRLMSSQSHTRLTASLHKANWGCEATIASAHRQQPRIPTTTASRTHPRQAFLHAAQKREFCFWQASYPADSNQVAS